jgi:hypothetical protein
MSSHPFDARDIRRGMDVYAEDGHYLGVVLTVAVSPTPTSATRHPAQSSLGFTGESLGPAPTAELGNTGPFLQRRPDFQSRADGAPMIDGSITVGRWFGLIGRRSVPAAAIQNVSMERVILADGSKE